MVGLKLSTHRKCHHHFSFCSIFCTFFFFTTGPEWTDSSSLVWWPTEYLSQGRLCENNRFEGHWYVEWQHLGLQQWTSRQATDCYDVECTLRMLAGIWLTPLQIFTSRLSPLFVAKSVYSFLTVMGCDFSLSSGMHTCTSGFIVAFIAVVFECSYDSDIPLCQLKLLILWKRNLVNVMHTMIVFLIDRAYWDLCTFFLNKTFLTFELNL